MAESVFVTGTGTDVGKTYVTALLAKKLRESGRSVAYYKAAMSGNERDANKELIPQDAMWVKEIAGLGQDPKTMCSYVYEHAYSPHLASKIEGDPVQLERVVREEKALEQEYDAVLMEGSGGILCPICEGEEELWLEDVIKACGLSCVIVTDAGLGAINNVLLTVSYMRAKNIAVNGIIFNHYLVGDPIQEDNKRMCEKYTGLKILACVKDKDTDLEIDEIETIFGRKGEERR